MAKMFLIDGSNHAFRVHFALPPMHAADGFPTRALYGFTTLLAKLVRVHQPDYVVVSFDQGASFRNELFADYKGHRPDMPEDLRQQWPHLPELVEAFGYKTLAVAGYEADDVLGTLAARFAGPDLDVKIVTGDRDFYQLVNDHVHVLDEMKDEDVGPAGVLANFGVPPHLVTHVKGLAGDSSDNLPGVPGVGEKTAVKWVQEHGTLDGVLAAAGKIGGKRGQALTENADIARLCQRLATIVTDVPLGDLALEDLRPRPIDEDHLREMMDRFDFGKVARKLLPERAVVTTDGWRLCDEDGAAAVLAEVKDAPRVGVVLDRAPSGRPRGLALAWGTACAWLPWGPSARAIVGDDAIPKVWDDAKTAMRALDGDLDLRHVHGDVTLLDYVMAAHERERDLGALAQRHLGHTLAVPPATLALPLGRPDDAQLRPIVEAAVCVLRLEERLLKRLDDGSAKVYHDIELPLVPLLADMERAGVAVDRDRLGVIRADLVARVKLAEERCHAILGHPFNVNSIKDVADALFVELGFVPTKKTKGGWSTDSSVLEKLADGENLPTAILEYRQLQGLVSRYLDKLPEVIGTDGRVHTTFKQAVAATGRLASADPNLQNIPIRSYEGRRIRDAFVPAPGHVFVSADYSQIELRVLAHLTQEEALLASFRSGEDIHRRTASEVFGTPLADVTFEERNAAKAINFGLMYGMSSFRLSNDLQITREQAQKYMEEYFGRFPRITAWLDETRQTARKVGSVATMFGRRRVLPTMHAASYNERMAAEREAVNTCVQGTAADIIKLAMLRVAAALRAEGLKARMLLQVHDELLIEAPEDEVAAVSALLTREMASAAALDAPLVVNVATGRTWNEAHG